MSLFAELRRRNVVRVAVAYVVIGWVIAQIAEFAFENFGAPDWVLKSVVVVLLLGLPLALFFAWAFELTPEGVKREKDIDRSKSITHSTGRKLNFVIIAGLVVALAYFVWERQVLVGGIDTAEPASSTAKIETTDEISPPVSIAVLPFADMSPEGDQEYFSDGIAEEILNALAKSPDLRVISRSSAFSFKGENLSIPDVAARLKVSHVLEGSVRKSGDRVRITAQLIEVASDSHLWSEAYSRDLDDVFEIQEEISKTIASQLQLHLVDPASGSRPTTNLEAYQLYLQGRHFYQDRGTEALGRAVTLLRQAVEIDPEFDEAWANLGAAAMVRAFGLNEGFLELQRESEAAANRAIQINPRNGLGHAVLGMQAYAKSEFEVAMQRYDEAIELNPNESNAYLWRAITLSGLGYDKAALADLHAAESFDPVFTNLHYWLVSVYENTGQYDLAQHHLDQLSALDASFEVTHSGDSELAKGDIDAAEAVALNSPGIAEGSAEITRLFFAALRDPGKIDEVEEAVRREAEDEYLYRSFGVLFRLGRVESSIALWKQILGSGRGLRAHNQLGAFWKAYDRKHLAHPAMPVFFEEIGLADYWRKHGDPDYCRRSGDSFVCGDPQ